MPDHIYCALQELIDSVRETLQENEQEINYTKEKLKGLLEEQEELTSLLSAIERV